MKEFDFPFALIKLFSLVIVLWGIVPLISLSYLSNLIGSTYSDYIGAGSFFISLPILLLMVYLDNKKLEREDQDEYFRNLENDPI